MIDAMYLKNRGDLVIAFKPDDRGFNNTFEIYQDFYRKGNGKGLGTCKVILFV